MTNAVFNGTGIYLPKTILKNTDLEQKLDTTDEWIYSRTGISSRRVAQEHETTSYMAGEAAKAALADSGLKSSDIDLILVATCTPNHFFPSMACHVQSALGINNAIPAFDVGAACSGFVYALDVANQYIRNGSAKHVMVVGSESMSRAVDWSDRSTCVLFGDGAAAAVISASDRRGIIASALHAQLDSDKFLTYPNTTGQTDTSFIGMAGSEVYKLAVNAMTDIVDEVLKKSGLNQHDIKWLIPHQANIRIIQAIAKKLDLSMDQVIITIDQQGNTSAASIPLAIDHAIRQGKLQRGDVVLIEAFGGGMTWGATVFEY